MNSSKSMYLAMKCLASAVEQSERALHEEMYPEAPATAAFLSRQEPTAHDPIRGDHAHDDEVIAAACALASNKPQEN